MLPSLGSFVRLLIGVLLVQAVTALIVAVALDGDWRATWPLYAALGGAVGVMAAFWFNAIVGDHRRLEAARQGARFAKQAETLRRNVERQATRRVKETEAKAQALARAERRRSWRSGLGFGGAAALGVMLLMGQMLAMGLLVLGATGVGAAVWRLRRTRTERLDAADKTLIEGERVA